MCTDLNEPNSSNLSSTEIMTQRVIIETNQAPKAIGPYSQAVQSGSLAFLSGQIGLHPETMDLVKGGVKAETEQVFRNIEAITTAAGGSLACVLKMTIFLKDMNDFKVVNQVMADHCKEPYPARSAVQVAGLPKNAAVEIETILTL